MAETKGDQKAAIDIAPTVRPWDEKALQTSVAALAEFLDKSIPHSVMEPGRYFHAGTRATWTEEDTKSQKAETAARKLFGSDTDGSSLVPLGDMGEFLADAAKEGKSDADRGYPRLVHPCKSIASKDHDRLQFDSLPILPSKFCGVRYAASLDEFRTQFRALTCCILDKVLGKLPLVAAGGSVLAALHKWPAAVGFPDRTNSSELLAECLW